MSLNNTPRANRIHIGIFGRRNAGKSSLINALTGQDLAIVSPSPGTTADPVFKSMELHPVGPVVFIDTAGFDDEGELGNLRVERTKDILDRTDLAVLVMDGVELAAEQPMVEASEFIAGEAPDELMAQGEMPREADWVTLFRERRIPLILVINKWEMLMSAGRQRALDAAKDLRADDEDIPLCAVSAKAGGGIEQLRELIAEHAESKGDRRLTEGLIRDGELVLLVMPQDIQAPKGRLILPQVQTIRELLDRKCSVVSTTADGLGRTLDSLARDPDLIVTDSQCFGQVWEQKPEGTPLTSFSILMAGAKGDIETFVEGASSIDDMIETTRSWRILIAEACTHVPQTEDIGTVKIPRLLEKTFGDRVEISHVRGADFPDAEGLKDYDLIIHCGACMFNRTHVMNRIAAARTAGVPITNYGIFLAKMNGILDKVDLPKG